MKKSIIISIILVLFISIGGNAQKFKYGHLNGNAVFSKMAETKMADSLLKNYTSELEAQIEKMSQDYQAKLKNYQDNETKMSDLVKKTQVDDINSLSERIKQFQVSAQESLMKKKNELYQPIVNKFNAALKDVAKENQLSFIIDNSQGALLYYDAADDVTKLVEKKLGIK